VIGAVLVTHLSIGQALCESLQVIAGKCLGVRTVSILPGEENEAILTRIREAVDAVASGKGVIIFTDMFGGTPSNLSLTLYQEGTVEVVTGVNLPMLVKYYNYRESKPLGELALLVKEAGKGAIAMASDYQAEG
jgi:PTS system mannose-specific IIA component